ncbi:hypothetical protein [Mesorhizobium sp. INR15]|uniref:hypothetical protein n=1 Tax=Mesorhizobium sp. INR15 TaxID=2654248 RepID=UPI0018964E7F|nr:hypothetical protein GA829_13415 [Mesorhizobium sp. INR15]
MAAGHIELVLFEQSLADGDGMHRPFGERIADAADKTSGHVLFDVRVDGDAQIRRMAAIGYGDADAAIVVLEKGGQLKCTSVNGDSTLLVADLAAWEAAPLRDHVRNQYHATALILLSKLRGSGHLT